MAINYRQRLQNTRDRKFDNVLNESLLSRNFSSGDLPDNLKYLLEAMRPIDTKYNATTLKASENVKEHLEAALNLHFKRAYRRQGSVETKTNIKVHSDSDLLTLIDRYYYIPAGVENKFPYNESDPDEDIKNLRRQAILILKRWYDEVDDSNEKCISIFNKNLRRKVDVVPAYWYHSEQYIETNQDHYMGVKIASRLAKPDYPFAHINNVNHKGDQSNDGSRKAIRLAKTLRADSDRELELLKSFQITSIVHAIDNSSLNYYPGLEINVASALYFQLTKLIEDPLYRKSVKSPNGMELPLENDNIVPELRIMRADLGEIITDATNELNAGYRIKEAVRTYN